MNFLKKYVTRRSFIKQSLLTIVSLELVYVFINLMRKSGTKEEKRNLYEAGEITLFERGRMYPFSSGKFYLSCLSDGGFIAISTKCTHLGCTVQFRNNDEKFMCPCHASAFNNYGEVLSPPATRALDIFPVSIVNGKVLVDIGNPRKRNKYESTQVTYA